MNVAIIPARGGSKRIPGKNRRLFHGKPIIAYSIATARASGCFKKIYVSTDDKEIAAIAKAKDAKIHHRAPFFAADEIGTQDVTRNFLQWLITTCGAEAPEFTCCIYATAPLMTAESLRIGLRILREGEKPFVHTVHEQTGEDAAQWYWGRTEAFLDRVPLDAEHTTHLQLLDERVCDINTLDDWIRAERMYTTLHQERVT